MGLNKADTRAPEKRIDLTEAIKRKVAEALPILRGRARL